MVIEQHPSLQSLSPAEKLQLSEELCLELLLDAKNNALLNEEIKRRYDAFESGEDTGTTWNELKTRLLSRLAANS
jgi:hypothetical protein